jgi:hypothetical protein
MQLIFDSLTSFRYAARYLRKGSSPLIAATIANFTGKWRPCGEFVD